MELTITIIIMVSIKITIFQILGQQRLVIRNHLFNWTKTYTHMYITRICHVLLQAGTPRHLITMNPLKYSSFKCTVSREKLMFDHTSSGVAFGLNNHPHLVKKKYFSKWRPQLTVYKPCVGWTCGTCQAGHFGMRHWA